MNTHPLATSVATAVADRALDRLSTHLAPEVRLRALLPGGPIEEHGVDSVLGRFHEWFGGYDTVVLAEAGGDEVGDRVLVHYKLLVDPDADRHVVTQTLVCTVWEGRVGRIDLLCSGFRGLS